LEFIAALLIVLVTALALGEGFRRLGHAPLIGEVLAGLILGPSLLALVDTNPATSAGAGLGTVATLGVFFVVLAAGIEVGRSGLRQAVREGTAIVAVVEFIFPFYLGTLLAQALHLDPLPSLLLATGMAVTALPVSVRILIDFDLLQTRLGRAIVSVAIVNDIIAFAMLGVILTLQSSITGGDPYGGIAIGVGKILLFVLLVSIIGWLFLLKRADGRPHLAAFTAKLRRPEAAFGIAVALALGMGALAEMLGIHFVVGVFYAGVFLTSEAVGMSQFALVRNTTQSVGLGFLAPVFFAYVGLRISITQVDWLLVAVVTAVAFLGKIIGGAIGGYAAGFRGRELAALGIGLNARGMMELLLADIGLQAGIITQSLYAAIVFMTLVTTVCAPILLKLLTKGPNANLTV
jgi:Kef-type K+ transport system membrane component KefB